MLSKVSLPSVAPRLNDVTVMRVALILLLVLYHSFAPWCGNWEAVTEGGNTGYFLIGKGAYSFFLESFVFISGLLAAFGASRRPESLDASHMVVKKAKRLLLPSVIFSAVYYLLFYDLEVSKSSIVYSVLNGCGHLWFLPMLFWCFVGLWLVEKLKVPSLWVLLLSLGG